MVKTVISILKTKKTLWAGLVWLFLFIAEKILEYIVNEDFVIPVWAALLIALVSSLIVYVVEQIIIQKRIANNVAIQNGVNQVISVDCENDIDELEVRKDSSSLGFGESLFAEMKAKRDFYTKLANWIENDKALLSVQIYECQELPNPEDYLSDEYVKIRFRRVGGYSKKLFVTNCILFDEYRCSSRVYRKFYYIVLGAREYYADPYFTDGYNEKKMSQLMDSTYELIEVLLDEFVGIQKIEDISDEHFFYYRILMLLSKWAYDFTETALEACDMKSNGLIAHTTAFAKEILLQRFGVPQDVVDHLKCGKRSGMLGAFFQNRLQLFGNDNSLTKRSTRKYFAAPGINQSDRIYVLSYKPDALRITQDDTEYHICENMFKAMICELGG